MERCVRHFPRVIRNLNMQENIPLKKIPLPDLSVYRTDLVSRHDLAIPLKKAPFHLEGNLKHLPLPLVQNMTGWPWDKESPVKFRSAENVPCLSVVIPSYNQGSYIEEAIRSVLLQNYPNLELIVMDGGSGDETLKVLEHYKSFISSYISEQDRGQSHAINKGFSLAGGDLYYWLNSDDFMNVDSINRVSSYFIKDPSLAIAYGDGLTLDEVNKTTVYDNAPFVAERYIRFGGIVMSHAVIWRSSVHCAVWEDLQCAMDAELWLRLFNGRKSKHIQYPIGVFRRHAEQKTSNAELWGKKWQHDYESYIWPYYPAISKYNWKLRTYEFRLLQRLYNFVKRARND